MYVTRGTGSVHNLNIIVRCNEGFSSFSRSQGMNSVSLSPPKFSKSFSLSLPTFAFIINGDA